HRAGIEVMKLLSEITTQGNTAVLLVTHSPECASFMQTKLVLDDGCLKNVDLKKAQSQNSEQPYEAS
ncbi:ABC transporter ATP-binding protein, partial [Vibrio breoganii]